MKKTYTEPCLDRIMIKNIHTDPNTTSDLVDKDAKSFPQSVGESSWINPN